MREGGAADRAALMRRVLTGVLLTLGILAWLLRAVPAHAAPTTLYVDNTNPNCTTAKTGGTQSNPFCTISAANKQTVPGTIVQVVAGSYNEKVAVANSGTSASPIQFLAQAGSNVTVTSSSNAFSISSKSWVVVSGFHITGTTSYGINVSSSTHITLSGNEVSYSGQPVSGLTKAGIHVTDTTDSLIVGNTAHNNSDAGIYLGGTTTRVEIRGNTCFANARGFARAAPGIDVRSAGNTVDGNVTYANEDSGIQFYTGGGSSLVYNNVSYDNGDHGIDDLNAPNQIIVSNTVYNNYTAGINVEGSSSGATIANNISVNNALANTHGQKGNIRVDAKSVSGSTANFDLVNLSTGGTMMIWGSTSYASLAAFTAATGQEQQGIQAEPEWESPDEGDFRLQAGSPAIDSANSGVAGQPSTDILGEPRVDDLAVPNTGVGPRAYDDRGAYEYQPTSQPDQPPVVGLNGSPDSGPAPLDVAADASGSTDTDATRSRATSSTLGTEP
jgi:parallel beta-helix repeat protein